MSRFQEFLIMYIRVKNISQRDISRQTGVSNVAISRFVNGRGISPDKYTKLLIWLLEDYE